MVNHYHSSRCCPNCLSNDVYIHDSGWRYLLAKIFLNHQLNCQKCAYSWKQSKEIEDTSAVSPQH